MKATKITNLTLLALLLLPLPASAYEGRGYWNNDELNDLRDELSDRAEDLWRMVANDRQYRDPQRAWLYDAVGSLASEAQEYESKPKDRQLCQLLAEAEKIGLYVDQNQLPYGFLVYWAAVADQVSLLARYHRVPFGWDRSLARTDPHASGLNNDNSLEQSRGIEFSTGPQPSICSGR